jgi:hypothetical protein
MVSILLKSKRGSQKMGDSLPLVTAIMAASFLEVAEMFNRMERA